MLKVNYDVEGGLVNGSRGVVLSISQPGTVTTGQSKSTATNYIVRVRFLNKRIVDVVCHVWELEDHNGKALRSQIPLILAWSLTIHKVQGCTLDYAVIDLGDSIFENGQAYVALSRVRELKGLFVSTFREKSIKVSKEALDFTRLIEIDAIKPKE